MGPANVMLLKLLPYPPPQIDSESNCNQHVDRVHVVPPFLFPKSQG